MGDDEFDFDFATSKTVFPYLKKGSGKKMSNAAEEKAKYDYLKKGEGKLASDFHGETEFSQKRSNEVVKEQFEKEYQHYACVDSNFCLDFAMANHGYQICTIPVFQALPLLEYSPTSHHQKALFETRRTLVGHRSHLVQYHLLK